MVYVRYGVSGPDTYRVLELEDGSEPRLMDKIQEVVKVLHNGGFMHGGIRDVNMMTRHQCITEETVILLDFDWRNSKISRYTHQI